MAASIIGIFAKIFINNAFEAQDRKLARKLEKYQSTYQANLSLNTLSTQCIRFVRGTATATEFAPDFDLVVKLEPSEKNAMMQMKVLHIATEKPKALGKVSYAVSAQFQGYYIDQNNIGQTIKYDEQVIHTGKYGTDKKPAECIIDTDEKWDACAPVYPFPGLKSTSGVSRLTLKVAEVGTDKKKAKLENWRKLLGQSKDDISGTLSEAITELLD